MREYFEHVYNAYQTLFEFAQRLGNVAIVTMVYLTSPVWIIPYAIMKKRGDNCGQST